MYRLRSLVLGLGLAGVASAQTPLHVFPGDPATRYGAALDGAGDVDNDGHDDVVIGAPYDERNGAKAGAAEVRSGKDGSLRFTFVGAAGDQLGHAVSGAGDVNNDGFTDVIVGAPYADPGGLDRGSARVYSGLDGAVLHAFHGAATNDGVGYSVSEAGDVDADGHVDVVVGANRDSATFVGAGSVSVHSGKTGAILHAFAGDAPQQALGHAVGGAGDVDGDGYADLIAGAPFADGGGAPTGLDVGYARVYSGKTGATLHTFFGATFLARFGETVGGAGDVDGDGRADLIVGAPNAFSQTGYAQVFSGKTGASLLGFAGATGGERVGSSVAGAGDVNGDGRDDVLVGAGADVSAGLWRGVARLHSGLDGAVLVEVADTFWGPTQEASAGAAGDVDADGVPDLMVNSDSGAVLVHAGTNVPPLMPPYGASCPGTGGLSPRLSMAGSTSPGGLLTVVLQDAKLSSFGFLMGGPSATSLPAGCGCTLLVLPVALQLAIPVSPYGALVAGFTVPAGLSGAHLDLQAFVADAGDPCGFTASNGVSVDFP